MVGLVCGQLRGGPGPRLFESKMPWVGLPGVALAAGLDPPGAGRPWRRSRLPSAGAGLALPRGLLPLLGADELAPTRSQPVPIKTPYPRAVLHNVWTSMDEYYLSLPRKLRSTIRSRYRQLQRDPELKIELGRGPVDGAEVSHLARLTLLRHQRRLPGPGGPPAAYFDALAGDGVLWLTYRDVDERLLGVNVVFDDGRWLTDSLWGALDPAEGRSSIYFHRFLELISYMVERQRNRAQRRSGDAGDQAALRLPGRGPIRRGRPLLSPTSSTATWKGSNPDRARIAPGAPSQGTSSALSRATPASPPAVAAAARRSDPWSAFSSSQVAPPARVRPAGVQQHQGGDQRRGHVPQHRPAPHRAPRPRRAGPARRHPGGGEPASLRARTRPSSSPPRPRATETCGCEHPQQ